MCFQAPQEACFKPNFPYSPEDSSHSFRNQNYTIVKIILLLRQYMERNPLSGVKKPPENIQVLDLQIDQTDLSGELANVKATHALFSFQISFGFVTDPALITAPTWIWRNKFSFANISLGLLRHLRRIQGRRKAETKTKFYQKPPFRCIFQNIPNPNPQSSGSATVFPSFTPIAMF